MAMERSAIQRRAHGLFHANSLVARRAAKQLADLLLAGLAWSMADLAGALSPGHAVRLIAWVMLASIVGSLFQVTAPIYRLTTTRDVTRLGFATLTLMVLAGSAHFLPSILALEPNAPILALRASLLTGMFWACLRLARRVTFETPLRGLFTAPEKGWATRPTLLVGAGRAGSLVAQELALHPELGYRVLGFLDDDPDKLGARINGIRVLGTCADLEVVTRQNGITHAVLAIPSAPGPIVRKLVEAFQRLNIKVKTVPGFFTLLGNRTWKPDLQEISIEDVLRRDPIKLDQGALSQEVAGRVVLITGAGGSIGSELARQVAALGPKEIVLLGRGENSLWTIERNLRTLFPQKRCSLELMDIRHRAGLMEVFEHHRPDLVLHTAAHKHVPFLETHPAEAVENNIFGTLNVLDAALAFGTHRVINISTDKAVNPTNVLGASKRIAECLVLDAAEKAALGAKFASVRFGNVLGSRGSVVPIFREEIEAGGPITVTHAAMTRFFMTIPEASQLVLQAALFGEAGRIYILDMGEPVRILDLALDMVRLSGLVPHKDIQIEIVGLRPGEKIHEELFMDDERSATSLHPKLLEANPQPMAREFLEAGLAEFHAALALPYEARQPEIVRLLKGMVPTYKPSVLGVGRYGGYVKDRRNEGGDLPPERNRRRLG